MRKLLVCQQVPGGGVYGFQFHLEVDEPLIERWLNVPLHKSELEKLRPQITAEGIRRETPADTRRLHDLRERTFGGFIRPRPGATGPGVRS